MDEARRSLQTLVQTFGDGSVYVELQPHRIREQDCDKKVDIAQIPHDDRQVYASLRKPDTIGLFQVESRAQMASLPRNNPDNSP